MKSVSHNQLRNLIKVCYEKRSPLMIHGHPGIGKSDAVKAAAEDLKLELIDVRLSQIESVDLRGIPGLDKETKTISWYIPDWLPTEGRGILFFDEFNLADNSVYKAGYELIQDRKLGSYILPPGWMVIAAGNLSSDKANILELPAPLANRFSHIELSPPNILDWTAWALGNSQDPRIVSFLNFRDLLYSFDPKTSDKAFPTPRSWSRCSKLIDGVEDDLAFLEMAACASVGEGAGIELASFVKIGKKIDVARILTNPELMKEVKELSEKYSVIGTLAQHYKITREKGDAEIVKNIFAISDYLEPEFCVLLFRMCAAIDPEFKSIAFNNVPEFDKWYAKNGKFFTK